MLFQRMMGQVNDATSMKTNLWRHLIFETTGGWITRLKRICRRAPDASTHSAPRNASAPVPVTTTPPLIFDGVIQQHFGIGKSQPTVEPRALKCERGREIRGRTIRTPLGSPHRCSPINPRWRVGRMADW